MSKRPYRNEAKAGEVLLFKLDDNCWCYITMLDFYMGWLMDFYTSKPTRNPRYFMATSFGFPLFFGCKFKRCRHTVTKLDLTKKELEKPRVVYKLDPSTQAWKGAPTPYQVELPYGGNDYVTEEEAVGMFKMIEFENDNGELEAYIRGELPQMRRVEVPPEDVWVPPAEMEVTEDTGPVLVEVNFQCEPQVIGMEADEIAEHLGNDLDMIGAGMLMTMDSAGMDSLFEVILEVQPHRMKGAISQIRKTLKRLKAPPDTRIIEVASTGNIEHPLIAPPKGK